MDKEILMFGILKLKKINFTVIDVDVEKVVVSNKISFAKKTISTLLVTCLMVIKLGH